MTFRRSTDLEHDIASGGPIPPVQKAAPGGLKSSLMPMSALIVVILCTVAVVTSGCADSSAEQAGGPKEAAKAVKTDAVRQESVRRTLEVVGTLAAEDQVTVSSEVDGVVRRVLADLGDRVSAGQALVELDREKLQYSPEQQGAARQPLAWRCHS